MDRLSEVIIADIEAKRRVSGWMMPMGVLGIILSLPLFWYGIVEQQYFQQYYLVSLASVLGLASVGLMLFRVWQEFLFVKILLGDKERLKNKKFNEDLDQHLRMMAITDQVPPEPRKGAEVLLFRRKRRA